MSTRVSVLMTVYNAAAYLARSVDSLLQQSFANWELVVIENGSTDGSANVLDGFSDPRLRVLQLTANIGRTPALRLAFENARGEYIAVLDADDTCAPQRLLKQVAYLDAHPEVVLLGSWTHYVDAEDRVIGEWAPRGDSAAVRTLMASGNPIVHSSAMYRASAARAAGGYPPDAAFGQDLALWLNLLSFGEPAVLQEYLCRFRILGDSMTRGRAYRVDAARDKLALLLRARARLRPIGEGRRRNREELAIARIRYAWALARSGQAVKAARAAASALCRDPVYVLNNRITRGFLKHTR
ncbi:MAG: glycosyltransferase family 2 protein [Pseudomonadota bacterium]